MSLARSLFLLGLTTVALSACGELRQDLGLGRTPPDEFAVVERPPLAMPPDFGLRPPRPGAPRPQSVDTAKQAQDVLFNGEAPQNAGMSDAEKALLATSGAAKADASIRTTVDRESSQKVEASPHLVQELMSVGSGKDNAVTVDAEAEAARIKKAQEANQPVTQGATPVIEKQKSGWLGL